jgi:hypothetical protein
MQSNTCRLFFYPSQGSKETRKRSATANSSVRYRGHPAGAGVSVRERDIPVGTCRLGEHVRLRVGDGKERDHPGGREPTDAIVISAAVVEPDIAPRRDGNRTLSFK